MCTATTYKTKDFYFGRTLDYEFSYGDEIAITPRNFKFNFRKMGEMNSHYAIIGMAYVIEDYPLYYDAINEKGLGIAGLNFVGNAVYHDEKEGKNNVTQFEFIPWILGQCSSVDEAKKLIQNMNFLNEPFNDRLPLAQLHWIIADSNKAITVESVADGIKIYDNPVGVLTNNPPFDKQMFNLNNYMHLSNKSPENTFSSRLDLKNYSRGMGAIGLPGDLSSQSRFVRTAFVKMNSVSEDGEKEANKSILMSRFKIPKDEIDDIKIGEGKIIEIDNKKVGVYKANTGEIFKVKPICTHLGCELYFNNIDKTWECPCHGSKFSYDGKSIEVPSNKNLE